MEVAFELDMDSTEVNKANIDYKIEEEAL